MVVNINKLQLTCIIFFIYTIAIKTVDGYSKAVHQVLCLKHPDQQNKFNFNYTIDDFGPCLTSTTENNVKIRNDIGFAPCPITCHGDNRSLERQIFCVSKIQDDDNNQEFIYTPINPDNLGFCSQLFVEDPHLTTFPQSTTVCTGTVNCGAEFFCEELNDESQKLSSTTIDFNIMPATIPYGLISDDNICTNTNKFSQTCYALNSNQSQLEPDYCIEDNENNNNAFQNNYYRLRNVSCLIYDKDNTQQQKSNSTIIKQQKQHYYGELPVGFEYPSSFLEFCLELSNRDVIPQIVVQDDFPGVERCVDTSGCAAVPKVDNFSIINPNSSSNGHDKKQEQIIVDEGQKLVFKWVYNGISPSNEIVNIQYAVAADDNISSPLIKWIDIPFSFDNNNNQILDKNIIKYEDQEFIWNVPSLHPGNPNPYNQYYLRYSLTPKQYVVYPSRLVINKKWSCIDLQCGENQYCVTNSTANQPQCVCQQPTAFPNARFIDEYQNNGNITCQRLDVCNNHQQNNNRFECRNGGYYAFNSFTQRCASYCTCPTGHIGLYCENQPVKQCNIVHGRRHQQQFQIQSSSSSLTSQFTCDKCYQGYTGDYCEQCVQYGEITITYPSAQIIEIFEQKTKFSKNQISYDILIEKILDFISQHADWPREMVKLDVQYSGIFNGSYNVPRLRLIVQFIGDCNNNNNGVVRKNNNKMQTLVNKLQIQGISNDNNNGDDVMHLFQIQQQSSSSSSSSTISFNQIKFYKIQKLFEKSDLYLFIRGDEQYSQLYTSFSGTGYVDLGVEPGLDCMLDIGHPQCDFEGKYQNGENNNSTNNNPNTDDKAIQGKRIIMILVIVLIISTVVFVVIMICLMLYYKKGCFAIRKPTTTQQQQQEQRSRSQSQSSTIQPPSVSSVHDDDDDDVEHENDDDPHSQISQNQHNHFNNQHDNNHIDNYINANTINNNNNSPRFDVAEIV